MQYPAVNNTDLEFFSTPHCKVRNFSYRLLSLFLSGHALSLAPTGIQLHTLAAEFDGIVSAYTNIILFLSLQLAHTLRGVCHLQILIRNPSIHIRLAVKRLVTAIGLKQGHAMIALYPLSGIVGCTVYKILLKSKKPLVQIIRQHQQNQNAHRHKQPHPTAYCNTALARRMQKRRTVWCAAA